MIGLKPTSPKPKDSTNSSLNRTMIGLKRVGKLGLNIAVFGLNRTMIGLKPVRTWPFGSGEIEFESNYDRIETTARSKPQR